MQPNSAVDRNRRHLGRTASAWIPPRRLFPVYVGLVVGFAAILSTAHSDEPRATATGPSQAVSNHQHAFRTEWIRGEVVWLADALKSEFGISTVPEVAENSLAILTKEGQLLPIVEDLRGRAFRKDQRLRGKEMEILARRYPQQPMIQVLRIHQVQDGQRYEVDYWCDVCAIVMYETGPCACCQDDNRLRKRLVEGDDSTEPGDRDHPPFRRVEPQRGEVSGGAPAPR